MELSRHGFSFRERQPHSPLLSVIGSDWGDRDVFCTLSWVQSLTEQQPKYKIIIVGAGLGGLVVGIALSKKGHWVTILEAASELGELSLSANAMSKKVGAGIQIPPNSIKLLKHLTK